MDTIHTHTHPSPWPSFGREERNGLSACISSIAIAKVRDCPIGFFDVHIMRVADEKKSDNDRAIRSLKHRVDWL